MIKKLLFLGVILMLIAVVFAGSCSGTLLEESNGAENSLWFSDSMMWLTNEEKVEAIEIAFNTPEALRQMENACIYRVGLGWIAIVFEDSEPTTWWSLDYETVDTGIPAYIPQSVVIYPRVMIRFGEPEEWQVMVAVDLEAGEAVIIDENPARESVNIFQEGDQ